MKRLLILVLLMHFTQIHFGQEVRFSGVVSKNNFAVGEKFQLTYSVNVSASGFTGPDLSAFNLYSGPNQSSSMQIINGAVSQSLTYYYVLSAKKEGKFTIKPALLNVANGRVKSNEISIDVVKGNSPTTTHPPRSSEVVYHSAFPLPWQRWQRRRFECMVAMRAETPPGGRGNRPDRPRWTRARSDPP